MFNYASELLTKLAYAPVFYGESTEKEIIEPDMSWINEFNAKNLKLSQYYLYESEEITSIMANYPALLLRKKSTLYPEGRTSYRFKRELRKKVTIIGKTMFGSGATSS